MSSEAIVLDDDCEMQEHNAVVVKDPYLRQSTWPQQAPTGEDLALLPRRLFVYSLRHRKFAPVNVRYLKPNPVQEDTIRHLQLPDDHKRMIQAAVHSHLRKQRIERSIEARKPGEVRTQDFIANKGRGLLVMLHGEPGVGKTATAEAVAQSTQRPLFPISCSDLAIGWGVEERLEEIFRLAHLWDCVLLLDEADVFLAARSLREGPNTLVSSKSSTLMLTHTTKFPKDRLLTLATVFLRKLEYYNGILFLTTNRIGKLDPALTSRIHLILHYKRLGAAEAENIFRTNIQRLQQAEQQHHEVSGEPPLCVMEQDILRFANDHYNKHPKGKGAWNGRQIRNAFVVTAALARHEAEQLGLGTISARPQLRYEHFQEVEKLTREYDRFRAQLLGGDDSTKALLYQERNDDYEGEDEEGHGKVSQVELMRILYAAQQALALATTQAAGAKGNVGS
jgi:DNA polymerase III delta prime subunit